MALPIKMLATMLGISARDFAEGWVEGRARYRAIGPIGYGVEPASHFARGTTQRGASDAAVAFYLGVEK
jgi:hypothetical protein